MIAKTHFVVTLVGEAGADSTTIRALRHLLKRLLRPYSLRCTDVRQVDDRRAANHLHHNDGGKR
jgi:hypothetical protein